MTLAVKQADIQWFLDEIPGTSRDEVEHLKKSGKIVVDDEEATA